MKSLLFVLVAAVAVLAAGYDAPHVYCGRQLATVMSFLCDSQYLVKRAEHIQPESEQYGWAWLEPHNARQLGGMRYKKGGIADECCSKPCTEDELLAYC